MSDESDKNSTSTRDSESENTQSNRVTGNIIDRPNKTKDDWRISYAKGAIVGAVMLAAGSVGAMFGEEELSHTHLPLHIALQRKTFSLEEFDQAIQRELQGSRIVPTEKISTQDLISRSDGLITYSSVRNPWVHNIVSTLVKPYLTRMQSEESATIINDLLDKLYRQTFY